MPPVTAPRFYRFVLAALSPVKLALTATAMVLLAAAPAFAQQSSSTAITTQTAQLQELVDALRYQWSLQHGGERRVLAQRYVELQSALTAWNESLRSDADLAVMRRWLETALQASMPGAGIAMPDTPFFPIAVEAQAETVVEELAAPADLPLPAVVQNRPQVASKTEASLPEKLAHTDAGTNRMPHRDFKALPRSEEPSPIKTATEHAPAEDTLATQATDQDATLTLFEDLDASDTKPAITSRLADRNRPEVDEIADPIALAEPEPVAPHVEPASEPQPPSLAEHPAAADLDWGNPFVDDPLPGDANAGVAAASNNVRLAAAEQAISRTRRTVGFRPEAMTRAGVRVNLNELSARIRGYGRGLRAIEAELINQPQATGFELAGLVRELESLAAQRELIEIYFASLSEIERMAMEDLPSDEGVRKLVLARAASRREEVDAQTSASAQAERAVLQGVARKLAR